MCRFDWVSEGDEVVELVGSSDVDVGNSDDAVVGAGSFLFNSFFDFSFRAINCLRASIVFRRLSSEKNKQSVSEGKPE